VSATSVLLADDHPVFLHGLQTLLRSEQDFAVVAVCSNGHDALQALRELEPDLAVLALGLPGLSGLEVLDALQPEERGTRVVVLAAAATDPEFTRVAGAGAWGILSKDITVDQLLRCLRAVAAGRQGRPQDGVAAAPEREAERPSAEASDLAALTAREREIAGVVAQGLSNSQIARQLCIAEGTVKVHLAKIFEKLAIANRTELARMHLQTDAVMKDLRGRR
jgi:two-component system nitrate/nitrite response regulator NarL